MITIGQFQATISRLVNFRRHDLPRCGLLFRHDHIRLDRIDPIEFPFLDDVARVYTF